MRSATVKYKSSDMLNYFFFWKINREEKSLRHVTMVVNFWMTKNRKRHLKTEFAQFQTSSTLLNFIQFVKSW